MDWTIYLKAGRPESIIVDHETAARLVKAIEDGKLVAEISVIAPNRRATTLYVLPTDNIASMVCTDPTAQSTGFRIA